MKIHACRVMKLSDYGESCSHRHIWYGELLVCKVEVESSGRGIVNMCTCDLLM